MILTILLEATPDSEWALKYPILIMLLAAACMGAFMLILRNLRTGSDSDAKPLHNQNTITVDQLELGETIYILDDTPQMNIYAAQKIADHLSDLRRFSEELEGDYTNVFYLEHRFPPLGIGATYRVIENEQPTGLAYDLKHTGIMNVA